ncbi:MAG: hypothetical protein H6Q05_2774 [Acidobacteria bacterium]|jgi:hypothetical protein|nr:hypothetical protein [Acidobacteriota bacterium]
MWLGIAIAGTRHSIPFSPSNLVDETPKRSGFAAAEQVAREGD